MVKDTEVGRSVLLRASLREGGGGEKKFPTEKELVRDQGV